MKEVIVNIMDAIVGFAAFAAIIYSLSTATHSYLPVVWTTVVAVACAATWYVLSAILDKMEQIRIELEKANRLGSQK